MTALAKDLNRPVASGPYFGNGSESFGTAKSGVGIVYKGAVLLRLADGTLGLPQANLTNYDYVGIALKQLDATSAAQKVPFIAGRILFPAGSYAETDIGAEVKFTDDNTWVTSPAIGSGCFLRAYYPELAAVEINVGTKFG